MSVIRSMVEAAAECVKCGAPFKDGCDCWVRLLCPRCGRTRLTERDASDLPGTAQVQFVCNQCDSGDFSVVEYFDKGGNRIEAQGRCAPEAHARPAE